MTTQSSQFDITTAYLDVPKPLCYGLVRGSGNLVFQQELTNKTRVAVYLLGEGPWDSILRIWINRKLVALPDLTKVHFHPGLDGEIGFGMAAGSTGGDQHVDAFWTDAGGGFTKVTYGRYAYLMLKVPPDPGAPTADMEVLADYQAMKCRIFDNTGAQTAFQWTQNPAWWICDFLLRKFILREAKVNQPLVAAEKARFDWQSFVDAATYFDADIGGGIKRFSDGGLVFLSDGLTADRALEQMLLLCRSYRLDRNGKFTLYPDKPRASVFTFTSDNVAAGSLKIKKSGTRSARNSVVAKWRELAAATGGGDETRLSLVSNTFNHVAHQRAIGTRGPAMSPLPKVQMVELDYGNNTAERVARLGLYQLLRQLGDDTEAEAGYIAPSEAEWIGYEDSLAVEPGDVTTLHGSLSEEVSGMQFEVLEIEDRPSGERQYSGLEYMPNGFPDVAPTQQAIEATAQGTGIYSLATGVDANGNPVIGISTALNPQGSIIPLTAASSPFSYDTGDNAGLAACPYLRWVWAAMTLYRPDGSTISVPSNAADPVPGSPSLGQVAGGAKAGRTYFVRLAYIKEGIIRGIGAEASLAVSLNNLLTVAAPTAQSGYDGWLPMIGTATNKEILQSAAAVGAPVADFIAFGTNYTEPTAAIVSNRCWYAAFAAGGGFWAVADRLAYSTSYRFYPDYDGSAVRFEGGVNSVALNPAVSALMYLDGRTALTGTSAGMAGTTGASGGSGSGGGGGCVRKGSRIVPLGCSASGVELEAEEWIELAAENGCRLVGVPRHPVYTSRMGKTPLEEVVEGDFVVTDAGESRVLSLRAFREPGIKIKVEMAAGHLYWAGEPGGPLSLSHNSKAP